MARNDRRAMTDESIRDTLPEERLDVGTRNPLDLSYNLQADPAWTSTILNPEVFDSLARISEDIHNTRRTSRTKDDMRAATETMYQQEKIDYMNLQTMKNEADTVLNRNKMENMKKLYNYKEQARRGDITEQKALDLFINDIQKLQGENAKIGNYYIGEKLLEWGNSVFSSEYPQAVVTDWERGEVKAKGSLNIADRIRYLNLAAGNSTLKGSIAQSGYDWIKASTALKSPEDEYLYNKSVQNFYLAEAARILEEADADPTITDEEVRARVMSLIAEGTPNGKPFNLNDYPLMRDINGNLITEGKFGTWVRYTRELSDAEKLVMDNLTPDQIKERGYELEKDENGNPTGRIVQVWDASMDVDTRNKIIAELSKRNNSKNLHYSLAASDMFKRKIDWDGIKKGNVLGNSYLQQATLDSWGRDFGEYKASLQNIIRFGSPSQVEQAINDLAEINYKGTAAVAVMEIIRSKQGLGISGSQIANEDILPVLTSVRQLLNDNKGTRRIESGDVGLYLSNGSEIKVNLMIKESSLNPNVDKGDQNYAYLMELEKQLSTTYNELLRNPGAAVMIDRDTKQKYEYLKGAIDSNNFIVVNQDKTVSINENNVQAAKNAYIDAMTYAKYASGQEGPVYLSGELLSNITAIVKNLPGAQKEAALSAYSKIFGSEILSIGDFSNRSKEDQSNAKLVGMYQFLNNSTRHTDQLKKIRDMRGNGIFSPTFDNVNTLIKDRKLKLNNAKGATAVDSIDKVLMEKGIKPQYVGSARELGANLIAAAYSAGETSFDMKVFGDILDESFTKGEYRFATVYDTSKIYSPTRGGEPQENTLEGFISWKDNIDKDLNNLSITKGSTIQRQDATNNMVIQRKDKTFVSVRTATGEERPFTITNKIAVGVDGTTALRTKNMIAVLANNAYDLTNSLDPVAYPRNFEQMYGVTKDKSVMSAMSLLNTLNNPVFQQEAQKYIKDPSLFKIGASSTDALDTLLATGKSVDYLKYNTADEIGGRKAADYSDGKVKTLKGLIQFAKAFDANPNMVPTAGYSDTYYNGKQTSYKIGDKINFAKGSKQCIITSLYGWRINPITKKKEHHNGYDLHFPDGLVRARFGGVVKYAGDAKDGYGKKVIIVDDSGFTHLYGHFNTIPSDIKQGVRVNAGYLIGYEGSTGMSTGPHVHYEVRNATGKSVDGFSLVEKSSATRQEDPASKQVNIRINTRNNLKRQGYSMEDQELNYINKISSSKTFDKDDAAICGRSFGPASQNVNNLDPKSDYHKATVYAYEYALLRDKIFGNKDSAIAAMYPGVTFTFKSKTVSVPGMSNLTAKQILMKYKAGMLKNILNKGYWAPDNISRYDYARRVYTETK